MQLGNLVDLKVNAKGLQKMATWIDKFEEAKNEPNTMGGVVRLLGQSMSATFDSEGSASGSKWQGLSAYTQQVRNERGFNPTHPILNQTGKLRLITAGALKAWPTYRTGGTWTDSKGTSMTASTTHNRFHASVAGPKIDNHYGGATQISRSAGAGFSAPKGKTAGYLPARPFFGIPSGMADQLAETYSDFLMGSWQSLGGRMVKRTRGRILILGNQKQTHRGAIRK
jgi:hypothetical protein